MDGVVCRVDVKDAEKHPVFRHRWNKTENSDDEKDDTEKNRHCLSHIEFLLFVGRGSPFHPVSRNKSSLRLTPRVEAAVTSRSLRAASPASAPRDLRVGTRAPTLPVNRS